MRYYNYYRFPKYIDFDNGDKYYGEVVNGEKKGTGEPCGCGLYWSAKRNEFTMCENIKENKKNGMMMYSDGAMNIFGYYKNDEPRGSRIEYCNDTLNYFYIGPSNCCNGFSVTVGSDGGYHISEFDENGNYKGKTISYKYGRLYYEFRENMNVEGMIINEKKVGWEYAFNGASIKLKKPNFYMGIKPVVVKYSSRGNDYHYTYVGGVQTVEKKPKFTYVNPNSLQESYLDPGCGYGMMEYNNGDFYFGSYADNVRSGFGCCRYPSSNATYVGSFSQDKLWGLGLLSNEKGIRLGTWYQGWKHGTAFEFKKDHMLIKRYHNDKAIGHYYKIYKDSFDMEEYDEFDYLIAKHPFVQSKEKIEKIKPIDKIDPKILSSLDEKGYEYEVTKDSKIIITKCNIGRKIENVPTIAVGIGKYAYEELQEIKKVTIYGNVSEIGEGCFNNCENIDEFTIYGDISVIPSLTCTSKKLKEVRIPKSVKRIKINAFRFCQNLKKVWIDNPDCVIERDAFPYKCEIIRAKKVEVPKTVKEEKEKSSSTKVTSTKSVSKRKFKNPFKKVGKMFASIPSLFKSIFKRRNNIERIEIDWLALIPTLCMIAIVVVMGLHVKGVIGDLSWQISWDLTILGYDFELSGLILEWFENTDHNFFTAITLGFLQIILLAIGFVGDIIVHILMFVLTGLFVLLQIIFQVGYMYVLPIVFPIWALIRLITTDNKKFALVCFVISLACSICYFILPSIL